LSRPQANYAGKFEPLEVFKVKNFIRVLVTGAFMTSTAAIAATWTGQISDSMCGAHHKTMAEHGKKLSARDCTEACVKNGGKYVLVSKGKVYSIDNQDFAGLPEHAGHTVKLTGDMNGDSIKVSDLMMPKKSSK
jgi:hypothetical protein